MDDNKKNNGTISVIMAVYNAEDTLNEAIDSILNQTYTDIEFVICDDVSTDNSYKILLEYAQKDRRVKVLRNEKNSKLAYSLNHCLAHCSGKYVARMDADDVSAPNRLEKQLEYLQNHPDISLAGCLMQRFDNSGLHDVMYINEEPDYYSLRHDPCFFHATIFTYKKVFDSLNGYTVLPRTIRGQDYDLWFRFFAKGYKGVSLQEPLYYVREDKNAIRRRNPKSRLYIFMTKFYGYRLLHYPTHWLIQEGIITLIKCLTPYFVYDWYRAMEAKK